VIKQLRIAELEVGRLRVGELEVGSERRAPAAAGGAADASGEAPLGPPD
jgi:hypothetical protein